MANRGFVIGICACEFTVSSGRYSFSVFPESVKCCRFPVIATGRFFKSTVKSDDRYREVTTFIPVVNIVLAEVCLRSSFNVMKIELFAILGIRTHSIQINSKSSEWFVGSPYAELFIACKFCRFAECCILSQPIFANCIVNNISILLPESKGYSRGSIILASANSKIICFRQISGKYSTYSSRPGDIKVFKPNQ
ncbi:hypothetical protein ES705_20206 [subsurface metagenome]